MCFSSSQDLKQGDHLSPSLFILGVEVISRMLNNLTHNLDFNPFFMNKNGPIITHLTYEDDIMIFTGSNNKSIRLVLRCIRDYEKASG